MLYTNITKFSLVVIFCWFGAAVTGGCAHKPVQGGEPPVFDRERSPYGEVQNAGRVANRDINESSGIASSKCQADVLWTHNDSGDGPYLFALDGTGRDLGVWKVENAANLDWEDIASIKDPGGNCFIYIGDIGNSRKEARSEHRIYRISEPEILSGSPTTKGNARTTTAAEILTFAYPDGTHDAETLLVHPKTGEVFVVTKERNRPARVYRIDPRFGGAIVKAEKVSEITVPAIPNGFLTGGDIAPDVTRLILCDYFAAYEFRLPVGARFDEVWKQKPAIVDLGDRKQGEAIGYAADGLTVYATSEGRNEPLLRVSLRPAS